MTSAGVAAALVGGCALAVRAALRSSWRHRARRDWAVGGSAPPSRLPGAPPWFTAGLAGADVSIPAASAWWAWVVGCLLAPTLAVAMAGPAAAILVLIAVGAAPTLAFRFLSGRSAARLEATLPGALEAVARSLRSGGGMRQALAEVASTAPGILGADLAAVSRDAEIVGVIAALEQWALARSLPGVRLATAALCLGAETGGAQARAIDGVAGTLRQRLAVNAEAHALASQARASAAVIALAPLLFCALASSTDPRVAAFLFRSGAGALVLGAGLVLEAAGAAWMARLTRIGP